MRLAKIAMDRNKRNSIRILKADHKNVQNSKHPPISGLSVGYKREVDKIGLQSRESRKHHGPHTFS